LGSPVHLDHLGGLLGAGDGGCRRRRKSGRVTTVKLVAVLVDSSLPRSAAALLRQMGHQAVDARDVGMRNAPDEVIAAHPQRTQLAVITRDFNLADFRNYPPAEYARIVLVKLPDDAPTAQVVGQSAFSAIAPIGSASG